MSSESELSTYVPNLNDIWVDQHMSFSALKHIIENQIALIKVKCNETQLRILFEIIDSHITDNLN